MNWQYLWATLVEMITTWSSYTDDFVNGNYPERDW